MDAATLSRLLGDWTRSGAALPCALADTIGTLLTAGILADRTMLPSQRVLAVALGVSRGTVTQAYDILGAREQLHARRGAGSRLRRPRPLTGTSSPSDGRLASFTGRTPETLDLSSGALPGLALVRDAMSRLDLGTDLDSDLATDGYHPAGLPRLREAIAAQQTSDGLPTDPDQILVTNGSQQAVWLLAHSVVDPGDEVVVEDPTYRGALEAFRGGGASLLAVPMREHGLDLDLLDGLLARRRPRLVYCQPAGHNPTGTTLTSAARRELADVLSRHGVLTVEDTSSADLVLDHLGVRTPLAALLPRESTLSVGTTSKLLWGGLRVGWLRGATSLVARLVEAKKAIDLGAAVIDQRLAADLLSHTAQAREWRRTALVEKLGRTEDLLRRRRPGWSWPTPAGGTGLWVDTGENALALAERARRRDVRLAAGPAFSAFNGFGHHIRLPFWHPAELLDEALDRLDR
ncbi:PLP-dependent aminotransferase family protein [Actinomadura sp. HBU206391]|uniref:aminotransferase-like domain-containing protein n=1 Tax=Actinomadura sp. HBU206391 TaxID=2731692 RepID=UPI00164F336B|nr:PLP-dependent aminotransferase family protein [Actinomadura sp. HBU206391]MBC6460699.1 PLP-dependent aminotransferase family protein [Actinomadura sp. HBU206391]